ncbi:MAG: adenosylcobinamide-phosphate synthase CbiB [Gammaproteobacteria bacterium]|nr:adenosylcobinamide-phosphate synthase CbiB [Gammaproteobacteria bacterium]
MAVDAAIGDPPWLYRRIAHPITLIGRVIDWLDGSFNAHRLGARASDVSVLVRGAAVSVATIVLASMVGWIVHRVCAMSPFAFVFEAIIASTLLAGRSLYTHVLAVASGLQRSLADGRDSIRHLVGRDPESLDEAGVARAAIESAAENFVDGLLAPVLWFAIGGLPALAAYKTINTLDSMIGHHNARYEHFGKMAARIDDAANWIPARVGAALFVLASVITPGANPRNAWQTALRFAPQHRSVNAGWPEASMAGAFDFALAGPRQYGEARVDDAWMGDGRKTLSANDVHASLRLYLAAWLILFALIAALGWAQG